MHSYQNDLLAAWQGEKFGEAFFSAMKVAVDDPDQQAQLAELENLERTTGAALGQALTVLGIKMEPPAGPGLEEIRQMALQAAEKPWLDFWREMIPSLESAEANFRIAESRAPARWVELAGLVTQHEVALLAFARREIQGCSDSLEPVKDVIDRLSRKNQEDSGGEAT